MLVCRDLSFAGQQETFLNVRGEDAVVAAVKDCWASLWTAQAISYRHQNGIDQDSVAMAVVVQLMVPSEVLVFCSPPIQRLASAQKSLSTAALALAKPSSAAR